jgi:hypothetical protein
MRLLEALHKRNRPPHCIDTGVRAAACWRSCRVKKCRRRKYAGSLDVEYQCQKCKMLNIKKSNNSSFMAQPSGDGPYATCAPSFSASSILRVPAAHTAAPNILQHQPPSPHVRARKCGVQHAAALQRSAPSAATRHSPPRRRWPHVVVAMTARFLIFARDAWGGVVWNRIAGRRWKGNEAGKGPKG